MGILVGVEVGVAIFSDLFALVLVGGGNVRVGTTYTVAVFELLIVGRSDGVGVTVAVAVGVSIYCEITAAVNAAIVFKFEKAESTIFCGAMETGCD